ncbi:transmembrane protein 80 isoform X3 [Prionailurus bengalensis]|uniref:transmembrane protein 80 isoform X3 n=1 Tax=Prionailurus bengalensis TaxID=37029 RepID=UPI001CA83329|nr:transmembrane protein 80 isoform X3 [Prionailurus bengalensis]
MAEGTGRARSRETAGIAADWAGGAGRQDGGRAASCQELLAGKTETRECAGQQAGRPAKRWSPLCVCLCQSRALSSDLCERPPLARRVFHLGELRPRWYPSAVPTRPLVGLHSTVPEGWFAGLLKSALSFRFLPPPFL